MNEPKPSVGRIVHFKVRDPFDDARGKEYMPAQYRPAIITRVWEDNTVDLEVFGDNPLGMFGDEPQFRHPVKVKQGFDEKQWRWPPRI